MPYLEGWNRNNKFKLIIDHTKIDAALTHFPVVLLLSEAAGISAEDVTAIFDELGTESLKLAVTETDGLTQLYVEVAGWDSVNKTAELHASRPGFELSSTADTILYLYYDSTHADNTDYVGVTGSVPAMAVWDANFVMVHHMADNPDTSHTMDSTSNNNDGTKGTAGAPAETTSGKIGDAQVFNAATSDYIVIPTGHFAAANQLSVSFLLKIAPSTSGVILSDYRGYYFYARTASSYNLRCMVNTASGQAYVTIPNATFADNQFHEILMTYDGTNIRAYVDNVEAGNSPQAQTGNIVYDDSRDFSLGREDAAGALYCSCTVDEVRISNTARSAAWIKATKATCFEELVTFEKVGREFGITTITSKQYAIKAITTLKHKIKIITSGG